MGRDLAAFGTDARILVEVAEEATGLPLDELMHRADATRIADPHAAQVLVFVWSTVALRELQARGRHPAAVAGHSLGEYTALVACGALDWLDALALVSARGAAMAVAAARRPGAMGAVVGLPAATVLKMCSEASRADEIAVVANLNSARQSVVSGTVGAITAVLAAAAAAGALRAKRLPVGGAYHSPLMRPAEDALAPLLRATTLRPPRVPMVSSMTGALVTDIDAYADALTRQVTSPVQWLAATTSLAAITSLATTSLATTSLAGETDFVEVGPGRVLAGLGRETLRAARFRSVLETVRPVRATASASVGAA